LVLMYPPPNPPVEGTSCLLPVPSIFNLFPLLLQDTPASGLTTFFAWPLHLEGRFPQIFPRLFSHPPRLVLEFESVQCACPIPGQNPFPFWPFPGADFLQGVLTPGEERAACSVHTLFAKKYSSLVLGSLGLSSLSSPNLRFILSFGFFLGT